MPATSTYDNRNSISCTKQTDPVGSWRSGSEPKGHRCFSHSRRTAKARRAHLVPKHMHTKASVCTAMLRSQLVWTLHIEYCFQREAWNSNIHDREPLAEVKRPAGGERRGSIPSMGLRKSSSTCRATSMVSSKSNSPS